MKPYDTRIEPTADVVVGALTSSGGDAVIGRVEVVVPVESVALGVRRAMAWTAAADSTGLDVVNVIDQTATRFDVRVALRRDQT